MQLALSYQSDTNHVDLRKTPNNHIFILFCRTFLAANPKGACVCHGVCGHLQILLRHYVYLSRAQLALKPAPMKMSLNLLWPGNLRNGLHWITRNHQKENNSVPLLERISCDDDFEPCASAQSKHLSETIKIPSRVVISSDIIWHDVERLSHCRTSVDQL